MRALALISAIAFAAFGCAPRYTWYNPSVDPSLAERQRDIDTAECTVTAMQSVPLPNPPVLPAPTTAPSNYSLTLYDQNGQAYTGTATTSDVGITNPGQVAIESVESNQYGLASYQAQKARHDLADACMMRRGWEKVMAGQVSTPPVPQATTPLASTAPSNSNIPPPPAAFQGYADWQKSHGN